jgi:hypothetical protein
MSMPNLIEIGGSRRLEELHGHYGYAFEKHLNFVEKITSSEKRGLPAGGKACAF